MTPTHRRVTPGLLAFLAWRDLRNSPVTATVLVGAAAAGVGFQLPNTANLLGYEAEMLEQGVKCGFGDVRLYPRRGRRIDDAKSTMARVRAAPGIHAVDAILILPGAIGHEGHLQSVATLAVDAPDGRWPFRLVEGQTLPPGDREGILIGRPLARRLGVGVGDQVELRVVLGRNDLDEDVGRYRLTVRGLFTGTFTVCATDTIVLDREFLAGELGDPQATDMLLVFTDGKNNAGMATKGGPEASNEDWQRNWQVNLMSHVYAARAVLPKMVKRGRGYLLQTASAAGLSSEIRITLIWPSSSSELTPSQGRRPPFCWPVRIISARIGFSRSIGTNMLPGVLSRLPLASPTISEPTPTSFPS